MDTKDLSPQDYYLVNNHPEMYMQRYSDHTDIINRYQVIENIYKFCIKYNIHVRYPCDDVRNNRNMYVIDPSIIEIGNITNLKYAVSSITCGLFSLLNYQKKNVTMTEILNEILL